MKKDIKMNCNCVFNPLWHCTHQTGGNGDITRIFFFAEDIGLFYVLLFWFHSSGVTGC